MALPEEPIVRPRGFDPVQLSVRWPGVWAGFLIAMGVFVILTALGLAVGATSVSDSGNAQALARGAAWWGGISFLIALFIGGAVSARWVTGGLTSVLQGALVWVLSVAAVVGLAAYGITLGANGLFAGLGTRVLSNPNLAQMANNITQGGQVGTTGQVAAAAGGAETGAWITFIVLIVSAICAIIGAVIARQKYVRPLA